MRTDRSRDVKKDAYKQEGPSPLSERLRWALPCGVAFVASFCLMVVELVAGRLVARHLGSSLYTWTSVIGVVMAGLAVGNYTGGRLADRYVRPASSPRFLRGKGGGTEVCLETLR
jgi:predicted membrane-bound spermidine synthase